MLLATKWVSVFGPFRPIFGQKIDSKLPRSHFFPKRIHQKNFQLKIPIFGKSDDDATWWPNSYKTILTCGQLRSIQRHQKYVGLVRAFFLELRTYSSQQCPKCSANPITVTPIWKWEFENKEHPIRGLHMTFFEKFLLKFPFSHKRFQMGQKCIFINCTSCNGSSQQIPFQFANGKLPHSRCRAFWAISTKVI